MIRANRPVVDRTGLAELLGLTPSQAHRKQPWNEPDCPEPVNNPSGARRGPLWDRAQARAFAKRRRIPDLPTDDADNDLLTLEEAADLLSVLGGTVVLKNTLSRYVDRGQAPAADRTIHGQPFWYRSTITGWQRPGAGAGAGRRAGPDRLSPAELRIRAKALIDAWPAGKPFGARRLAAELHISPTTAASILRALPEPAAAAPAPAADDEPTPQHEAAGGTERSR